MLDKDQLIKKSLFSTQERYVYVGLEQAQPMVLTIGKG